MSNKKGFTLMELVVVMLIIGILAIILVPSITNMLQQGAASNAEHNLIAIYNAQKNYYFNNNSNYCLNTANTASALCTARTGDNSCAGSLAAINCNLDPTNQNLNIADNYFNSYSCSGSTCTATSTTNPVTLTVTLTSSVVLPGGTSGTLNPLCSPATSSACPTS